jgi:hypothetical protein
LRVPVTGGNLRGGDGAHSLNDIPVTAIRRHRPAWLDWLDATDPGLMRLRMATEVMVAIALVLVLEFRARNVSSGSLTV